MKETNYDLLCIKHTRDSGANLGIVCLGSTYTGQPGRRLLFTYLYVPPNHFIQKTEAQKNWVPIDNKKRQPLV